MSADLILSAILLAAVPQVTFAQGKLPPCPASHRIAWTDCEGSYTYDDWSTYTGAFKDDKRDGQGTIVYPDGQTYTGGFKRDRRDGPGVYTSPNGAKWTGAFKDDLPNGRGALTDKVGNILKLGVWRKGVYVDDRPPPAK